MTVQHFNNLVIKLEQLRRAANLTQIQLAVICGFSSSSNWSRLVSTAYNKPEIWFRFDTRMRIRAGTSVLSSELKLKRFIPLKTLKTKNLDVSYIITQLQLRFIAVYGEQNEPL